MLRYNEITTLAPITEDARQQLLLYFANFPNESRTRNSTARGRFAFITNKENPMVGIVKSIIDQTLGTTDWKLARAVFFETQQGYYIHADRYHTQPDASKIWQAFIFPLDIVLNDDETELPDLKVLVFDQLWDGLEAITASRNKQSAEHGKIISDYSLLKNYKEGFVDPLFAKWTAFQYNDVTGLSVSNVLDWKPGVPLTFPLNRLHCSSRVQSDKVKSKIGFTIFTEMP